MNRHLFKFKGLPYFVSTDISRKKRIVEMEEKDFKKMKDYIMELEWKLHKATGGKSEEFLGKVKECIL